MGFNPTAAPGFAVADAVQGGPSECRWEIQTESGVLVGRFMEGGYGPHQISAGSGIFFGIHGQQTAVQAVTATRRASMTEDPSLRRSIGGGYLIHTFHIAPSYPPALTSFPDGSPAVFHESFVPVTTSNPARAGEQLIVQAVNLGFTNPAVNPGVAFSNSPYSVITGPVEAILGGQALETRNQLGWPTLVNTYRVDFTVPNGVGSGMVDLQLRVSGIAGPSVKIPVQ